LMAIPVTCFGLLALSSVVLQGLP